MENKCAKKLMVEISSWVKFGLLGKVTVQKGVLGLK